MKKLLSLFLALIGAVSVFRTTVSADEPAAVSTSARAYALYCVNNGAFLLSENADERLPMASTTKIMTALLTLEKAADDNRVVTFTEDMIAEGSSMYLEPGDRLTLRDLAVGMLMQSGNDAANAAAIALAGLTEDFAAMMNARAKIIGMKDTCFVTPSGLDAEGHASTAHDMALLMDAAMRNHDFAQITGSTEMTVAYIEPTDKTVVCPNHNKLLTLYDGCIGGKTGYTDAAGRCLVTCAEREGLRLIAVTLDDGDDWNDHAALYDYGFAHYRAFMPESVSVQANIVGGTADSVTVRTPQPESLVLTRDADDEVQTLIYLPAFLYAPVKSGDEVGRVILRHDGRTVADIPLYPDKDIAYNSRRRGLIEYIKDLLNWHSQ